MSETPLSSLPQPGRDAGSKDGGASAVAAMNEFHRLTNEPSPISIPSPHGGKERGNSLPQSRSHLFRRLPGALVSATVAALMVALFAIILNTAGQGAGRTPDIAHILAVSTLQASLSTFFSLSIGIGIAWAFNRLDFPGRATAIGLLSAALVTPGLVVAFGLIAVWGRTGWITLLLAPFGIEVPSIFGLFGIVYAHIVLDASFAAALLLPRLDGLAPTRLRLGRSLALKPWTRFRVIDWPALAPALPGLAAIIFLLSFTSFPIVLTLGGGPANQTLEVAIYAAVRLDFDLGAAVQLALVQLLASAVLIVPATAFSLTPPAGSQGRSYTWPETRFAAALATFVLAAAALFLLLPLVAVLFGLVNLGDVVFRPSFWQALTTSLLVGCGSAVIALFGGLAIAGARARTKGAGTGFALTAPVYAYLAMPGVTLSLGFFLGVRALGLETDIAGPFVLVIAGALLAMPYAVSTLLPALSGNRTRYAKLSRSLGLGWWSYWWHVDFPLIGREIGLVLAIGFCFSLGDLGVISLFGTAHLSTLGWAMQRALGAYRSNDAAAISAIMLATSIIVFVALPRLFERLSRARA